MTSIAHYDLLTPRKIVFGWGRRDEAGALAATLGRRAFVVNGSRTLEQTGVLADLIDQLRKAGVEAISIATISREPEVADVDQTVSQLTDHQPTDGDFVIGIGGGSAIDLAKAVAAMATNAGGRSVQEFLEGVGTGATIDVPPLPMMAIPTTSGTGSEATKNAVISSYNPVFKKSLRSEQMVPAVVLVDPELTAGLPSATTAHTGMDAITQLMESQVSKRAKPIPQALCLAALDGALDALEEAVADGGSKAARVHMAHAALSSGIALANSGLGLAHGVAAALGVHCRVPHGLACAVMLPTALRVNSRLDDPGKPPPDFLAMCRATLHLDETDERRLAHRLIDAVSATAERIGIPARLSELGVTAEQLPAIVNSSRGNSMSGNPREFSDDELHRLLEKML